MVLDNDSDRPEEEEEEEVEHVLFNSEADSENSIFFQALSKK